MQRSRFRSAATVCLCAAVAVFITPGASAENADSLSDTSKASVSDQVAELTRGRDIDELSGDEFSALMDLLPADGTAVEVMEPNATMTPLSAQVAAANSSLCETSSQAVWIRKSSGYNGVGTKPTTTCTKPFQSVKTSTQLAKKNTFGNWINQGSPFVKTARNLLTYTNKDITLKCTNTKSTTWNAVTTHEIVMHYGTRVTLFSTSGPSKPLKCGT